MDKIFHLQFYQYYLNIFLQAIEQLDPVEIKILAVACYALSIYLIYRILGLKTVCAVITLSFIGYLLYSIDFLHYYKNQENITIERESRYEEEINK